MILWWLYAQSRSLKSLAAFCLGLGLVLLPFLGHNYLAQGTPLPFQGAWSFYMGTNPAADGTPYARQGLDWQHLETLPYQADMAASPAAKGQFYLKAGLRFIADQPLAYLGLLYSKFRLFWHTTEIPVSADIRLYETHSILGRLLVLGFGVVAPLALVGMAANWHRRKQLALLYGFALSFLASGLLFTVCAPLPPSRGTLPDRLRRRDPPPTCPQSAKTPLAALRHFRPGAGRRFRPGPHWGRSGPGRPSALGLAARAGPHAPKTIRPRRTGLPAGARSHP